MVEPELIRAAQSGDRDALITLLREIEQHVYRTAYYILNNEQDALDAAQEALIRIYTKINSYEEKAHLKPGYNASSRTSVLINSEEPNHPSPLTNMTWFFRIIRMWSTRSCLHMWPKTFRMRSTSFPSIIGPLLF